MNHSDSEKIASRLQKQGYRPATSARNADLIVLNACSVRQGALNRSLGQLPNLGLKKIIVTGCLLLDTQKKLADKKIDCWLPADYWPEKHPCRANQFSALVPIMTGCDNFCAYCVVPLTRGREKSRPAKEILAEINSLIKNGVKEITLLGQNVNSYRDKNINFPKLLKTINALPGSFWLSFVTSHPKDMSDELIKTAAKCLKVSPYLHLPVQSGDDQILKKMNRHYTVSHYKNLIKKIRRAFKKYSSPEALAKGRRPAFPPIAISTDIIVGFPGETKTHFTNSARLARQLKFDMIYFAPYSPRPGTAATKLKDDVTLTEKKRRAKILNSILSQTALANNQSYLNRQVEVLITEIKNGSAFGKTATNKTVKIEASGLKIGARARVKIFAVTPWSLKAKLSSSQGNAE